MVFEDYFSELQADMVSICLEYVRGKADKIYIYNCFESRIRACGFFFVIDGKLFQRGLVDQINFDCDITLQGQAMDIIMEDLYKLNSVCEEFNQPMPAEIKMVYDVKQNSLSVDYQYEEIIANSLKSSNEDEWLCPQDIEEQWFDEISQQYPKFIPKK